MRRAARGDKPKKGKMNKKVAKKAKSIHVSMHKKQQFRRSFAPSTVEYKDVKHKFSTVHNIDSFLNVVYTHMSKDGNPMVDSIIDEEFSIPELPAGAPPEQQKDHGNNFGAFAIIKNCKSVISAMYECMSVEYQQRINAKYPKLAWRTIKDPAGVKSFIEYLRSMKKDERGASRGAAMDAQKAITNMRQADNETGAQYIVRATELMRHDKDLSSSAMSESQVVGFAVKGLKRGYGPLTDSWALDSVRDEKDDGGPATLEGLATALLRFESNSALFKRNNKPTSPSNFATDGRSPRRGEVKCFTCENAGRDARHDYKTCKFAKKRRQKNLADKGEDQSGANNMTTAKPQGKSRDKHEEDDEPQEDEESEEPERVVRLKKKQRGDRSNS